MGVVVNSSDRRGRRERSRVIVAYVSSWLSWTSDGVGCRLLRQRLDHRAGSRRTNNTVVERQSKRARELWQDLQLVSSTRRYSYANKVLQNMIKEVLKIF
ncbi:hypothetical protein Pst134EA_020735 [Puccinia striiformis f. sp. tritici]|uniref:hypothetical protein n=1 Tax=Puccinia striiformis f. sp. tritici TaxID=168172 RepID=UPI00200875B8|nr:hypothetical protein Pst134EA_020735 [Puccinia striiformis f. sp. tritici]KAH9456823.1 hypothetical protein Pst134EA_020735 [Puccinia striiformis f. sp. tritici]